METVENKKLYWADMGEGSIAIIARSSKEAREYAWANEFANDTWDTYIDMTRCVKIAKPQKDVSSFSYGEVDLEEGLRKGIYGCVYEYECERCLRETSCSYVEGMGIVCSCCEEGICPECDSSELNTECDYCKENRSPSKEEKLLE